MGADAVRIDRVDSASHFEPEQMPTHKGGGPTIPPDPDCCDTKDCPQRDYNRAVILATLRLSQSYAALLLLQHSTRQLWHCSDGVHTDCATPECTFGSTQADLLAVAIDGFAGVVTAVYELLARPATDLTGQWQDLTDMELAAKGLEFLTARGEYDPHTAAIFLDTWKQMIVDDDAREFQRWFRPPPLVR